LENSFYFCTPIFGWNSKRT